MISFLSCNKRFSLCFTLLFCVFFGFAQNDASTLKAQIALGVNNPSSDGFVSGFEGQPLNFPTVNLGLQYMFNPNLGAKLDYGFSRMANDSNAQEFKLNYSRINLQGVYNLSNIIFISNRTGMFVHAGPGFSMVKPLNNYGENKISYLNAMAGLEFHYGLSDTMSLYFDASYIHGFAKEFNPISDGYGSFNGNVLTFTVGLSLSLSGCYYCN
ncbi:outer membrane beta-barrel protein [Aestuariibaculum suncheonense]|uniref:Outer membrane beta-barrel protein n=1 Tax=Aestuariibaculum suncheonense TaxID=1028745 RepID=A0A8J6Q280_9FLAO|nr:outer membrane beta-barrel protein [Aestuariibaculum suncheonense]MBD0834143.1 outer membrane beta-barrel protein [Aestuariibaculum suncheonense]